jgi:hypothetical protein
MGQKEQASMLYGDYLKLNPREYTRAVSFLIDWKRQTAFEDADMRIEIVLQHRTDDHRLLRMQFSQVAQLGMTGKIDYNHGLGAVLVKDISDRQWAWPWEVIETEDEGFFFYCVDFTAAVEVMNDDC